MIPLRNVVAIVAAVGLGGVVVFFEGAATEAALAATVTVAAVEICLRPNVRERLYGRGGTLMGRGSVVFVFTMSLIGNIDAPWYVYAAVMLAMLGTLGVGFENGLVAADRSDEEP